MGNDKLLEICIESLIGVRAEIHGDVDRSVIDHLDAIVNNLKFVRDCNNHQFDPLNVLSLLGSAIKYLPVIGQLIEYLSENAD